MKQLMYADTLLLPDSCTVNNGKIGVVTVLQELDIEGDKDSVVQDVEGFKTVQTLRWQEVQAAVEEVDMPEEGRDTGTKQPSTPRSQPRFSGHTKHLNK